MLEPARILVLLSTPLPAPSGRAARALALVAGTTPMARVDVLAPLVFGQPHLETLAGARLFRVPCPVGETGAAMARVARRQIASTVYDLVQTDDPSLLLALSGSGPALILDALSFPSIERRYQGAGPRELEQLREDEGAALRAAAAVLTSCAVSREHAVASGAPAARVAIVPPPVNLSLFSPAPLPPSPPLRLLYAGGREAFQGVSALLPALRLARSRASVHLTVVGPAPDPDDLRLQARELGVDEQFEVLGPVPHQEMPALHAACHAVVAPLLRTERNRRQGAAPMKIAEALACGRPVLAPSLPIVTAMLQDGVQGLLHEPGSDTDLARTMVALARDPALVASLGAAARLQAESRFGDSDACATLLGVYRQVLRAGGHAPLRPAAPVDPDRGTEPGLRVLAPRRP